MKPKNLIITQQLIKCIEEIHGYSLRGDEDSILVWVELNIHYRSIHEDTEDRKYAKLWESVINKAQELREIHADQYSFLKEFFEYLYSEIWSPNKDLFSSLYDFQIKKSFLWEEFVKKAKMYDYVLEDSNNFINPYIENDEVFLDAISK